MSKKEGLRFNEGKAKWSLVDFDSLIPMVQVLEFGAKKYDDHNWKNGLKVTELTESLLRHVFALLEGEDIDPESKLPHVGHIMCNAMFLSYMLKHHKNKDDRFIDPKKYSKFSSTIAESMPALVDTTKFTHINSRGESILLQDLNYVYLHNIINKLEREGDDDMLYYYQAEVNRRNAKR